MSSRDVNRKETQTEREERKREARLGREWKGKERKECREFWLERERERGGGQTGRNKQKAGIGLTAIGHGFSDQAQRSG